VHSDGDSDMKEWFDMAEEQATPPPEAEPDYLGAGKPAPDEDPRLKPDEVDTA
jgi:hypothetical protein